MAIAAVPILDPARWTAYTTADFALTTRASGGIDAVFTPKDPADGALITVGGGTVFFIPAGATKTPQDGPTVTPSTGKNILLVHVVAAWEWSPALAPKGLPVADWWALEGVSRASIDAFLDTLPLATLAAARQFGSGPDLKTAVLAGDASVNVLDTAAVGQLDPGGGGPLTLGIRCFAGTGEVPALSALANLPAIDGNLSSHPLVGAASATALASDLDIHVRFVYFKPKAANAASEVDKGTFLAVPRPTGAIIALVKRPAAGPEEDLASATPDTNGQVKLRLTRSDLKTKVSLAAQDKLFFRVRLPGRTFTPQYQHDRKPVEAAAPLRWQGIADEWKTEGFKTTDGAIDSLDFIALADDKGATIGPACSAIGTVDHPLEYYAGVPLFMQVEYPVVYPVAAPPRPSFLQEIRRAPKGTVVTIHNTAGLLGTFRTDEHGQVWGTLTQWDPLRTALEARLEYRMEDPSIGLIEISGAVGAAGAADEARFFSSKDDDPLSFAFTGGSIGHAISAPGGSGLARLRVGAVEISNRDQDVMSTKGWHAGVVFAFQHLRYVHQWFHYLTLGARANNRDASWSALFAANSQGVAMGINLLPPIVRVKPRLGGADNLRTGEIQFEADIGPAQTGRWVLNLYGNEDFTMGVGGHTVGNSVEFWRLHTVWHEYTHGVFNTIFALLSDNLVKYNQFTNAKDPMASRSINSVHDGWSTLEEAFAELPELALLESGTGLVPTIAERGAGNQQYWTGLLNPAVGFGRTYALDQGLAAAGVLDLRMGLRVADAFAWGLWTALKKLGTFECMTTLCAATRGIPTGNDLSTSGEAPYLASPADRTLFQRLVWSPILALRTPDVATAPVRWNDIDSTVAGPANGDATRPLVTIPGPTTLRWIETFKNTGYRAMSPADQTVMRNLFGSTPDPTGAQPSDQIPYFLWFSPW